MYRQNFSILFFSCLFLMFGSAKVMAYEITDPKTNPPKVRPYVVGNWNNIMDPRGCVLLPEDSYLKIKGVITVGVPNIEAFTPMFVYVNIGDAPAFTMGPILNSQLTPLELQNGQIVYLYEFLAFVDEFSDHCTNDPYTPIPLQYEVTTVDIDGDPYPIENHPELLQTQNSSGVGSNETSIIFNSTSYAGVKDLCCYGYDSNPTNERSVQSDTGNTDSNHTSTTATSISNSSQEINLDTETNAQMVVGQQEVFPNPFRESLTVKLQLAAAGRADIQLWDIQGRLIEQIQYSATSAGRQVLEINTKQLHAGFYYCTIRTDQQSETFKVLKLDQ